MLAPLLAGAGGHGPEAPSILAFVVIVIGGIGLLSIRVALVGALLVGIVDTIGRSLLLLDLSLFELVRPPGQRRRAGDCVGGDLHMLIAGVRSAIGATAPFPART